MSNQTIPDLIHQFINSEKQLEDCGEDIFWAANYKFNFEWINGPAGYRAALWAVIGDNPLLKLVPKDNVDDLDKCEFKS